MRFRTAQAMAVVVSVVMGAWVWVASSGALDRMGGQPPGPVIAGWVLGAVAAAVTYSLLRDGPRGALLVLRVRNRRDRR